MALLSLTSTLRGRASHPAHTPGSVPSLRAAPLLVGPLLVVAMAGCGPKSLAAFIGAPEVGYVQRCGELAIKQKAAVDDLRYFPPTMSVLRWTKELPGGK